MRARVLLRQRDGRLREAEFLALLRSYRTDEWTAWFEAAGAPCPVVRGAVFDSSLTLAEAAALEAGMDQYLTKPIRMQELQAALNLWFVTEPAEQT